MGKIDPVVGVISLNNPSLQYWVAGEVDEIDLSFASWLLEKESSMTPEEWEEYQDSEEYSQESDTFDSSTWLFGDWKKVEGKYTPDHEGRRGFAARYCNDDNIITVEWSKYTKEARHTSFCYQMKDGRPCGDLSADGGWCAYTLPPDWFKEEGE